MIHHEYGLVKSFWQKSPHQSGGPTEAGWLRAAALNLGFGAVPQLTPQKLAAGPPE